MTKANHLEYHMVNFEKYRLNEAGAEMSKVYDACTQARKDELCCIIYNNNEKRSNQLPGGQLDNMLALCL
ncbi:unnamed protein product [Echinostoma caproni]|uniref:Ferritin n=1 Tax=Echinostoma caproni TaxID=27848 RepID=A0A183A5A8_9TREM|nr:unnamed protein product [Echinostoma caproni]